MTHQEDALPPLVGEFQSFFGMDADLDLPFFDELEDVKTLSQALIQIDESDLPPFPLDHESSSESFDNEAQWRLNEISDVQYDHTLEPRIGVDFQASLIHASQDFPEAEEEVLSKAGELVWSPEGLAPEAIDGFLAATQCTVAQDVDVFYLPENNRVAGEDGPAYSNLLLSAATQADEEGVRLCTQEEALGLLMGCGKDVTRAQAHMRRRGQVWSAFKRDIEVWSPEEMDAFELGMTGVAKKNFLAIRRATMSAFTRTTKDLIHFFYTWKKLPRYRAWKRNRGKSHGAIRASDMSSTPYHGPVAPTPTKEDETFELRSLLGLRSRPRVDYSSSSSGQHIWRTVTGGYKRKVGKVNGDSSDTEDDRDFPKPIPFDIIINPDIDLGEVRAAKRARLVGPDKLRDDLFPDTELLRELEEQEQVAIERMEAMELENGPGLSVDSIDIKQEVDHDPTNIQFVSMDEDPQD